MIKVILNYNNGSYIINIQSFEKLITLKKKVYQLFFPIKTDIDIKYENKSISKKLDTSVGILFKDKKVARLDIIAIPGRKKSLKIKRKKKNENVKEGQNNSFENQNIMKEIGINANIDLKNNSKNNSVGKIKTENNRYDK